MEYVDGKQASEIYSFVCPRCGLVSGAAGQGPAGSVQRKRREVLPVPGAVRLLERVRL